MCTWRLRIKVRGLGVLGSEMIFEEEESHVTAPMGLPVFLGKTFPFRHCQENQMSEAMIYIESRLFMGMMEK